MALCPVFVMGHNLQTRIRWLNFIFEAVSTRRERAKKRSMYNKVLCAINGHYVPVAIAVPAMLIKIQQPASR